MAQYEWLVIGDAQRLEDFRTRPIPDGFRLFNPEGAPEWQDIQRAEAVCWLEDSLPDAMLAEKLSQARLLLVHAMETPTDALPFTGNCVRINAWPGFLRHRLLELAGPVPVRPLAEEALRSIGWEWRWVDDQPGMATARILSMIVNEACLALQAGVSDAAGIDRAMELGASYPGGPFQWARQIGPDRITRLLENLSLTNARYTPAPGLEDTLRSLS